MKFIFENPRKAIPLFCHVEINQFFVNVSGDLCQKLDSNHCCTIADEQGNPYSLYNSMNNNETIKRILPKVKKIEF